ncbi:MAG: ACT domain-containing protein [Phycisphaerae bacterium]|nr:ACT domain-containing protein [Phycisphaerae bacterium]
MPQTTQFSVFTANKPGVLAEICRTMAREKINITGMSMMDAAESGVLRLITDKPDSARVLLQRMNIPMTETEVLAVTLPNRVGAVADVCERLSNAHIHIAYMYATTGGRGASATVVLKVSDMKKAVRAIEAPGRLSAGKDMKIKLRHPRVARRR